MRKTTLGIICGAVVMLATPIVAQSRYPRPDKGIEAPLSWLQQFNGAYVRPQDNRTGQCDLPQTSSGRWIASSFRFCNRGPRCDVRQPISSLKKMEKFAGRPDSYWLMRIALFIWLRLPGG